MAGVFKNRILHRLAAASALAAAVSLSAVPAAAAELPRPAGPASAQAYDGDANSAANHRHWRRHRGGIDGGDVLAGVLILGGIAAVASAVEKNNREDDYRRYPPPPPRDGYEYRGGVPQGSSSGLDRAADICADAIERTIDPVGSIDNVRRGASGWDVDGTLRDGRPFACAINNRGEIEDIRIDRGYSGAAYDGGLDSRPAYDGPSYDEPSYDDPSYDDPAYDSDDEPYYSDQSSRGDQYDDATYARLRAQQGADGTEYGG